MTIFQIKISSKVLGTFSKGAEGSLAVNMSTSATAESYCDNTDCTFHDDYDGPRQPGAEASPKCYANTNEKRKPSLRKKLSVARALLPSQLIGIAIYEIMAVLMAGISIPWVRFCAFGSMPDKETGSKDKLFIPQLRVLLQTLLERKILVHFPKEGEDAEWYREQVGDLVTVRRSFSQRPIEEWHSYTEPSSYVVGAIGQGLVDRVKQCRVAAREHAARTGRRTAVCPAVLTNFANSKRYKRGEQPAKGVKCGETCTLCADKTYDIVFPLHH